MFAPPKNSIFGGKKIENEVKPIQEEIKPS
jgi:hypothetical protein